MKTLIMSAAMAIAFVGQSQAAPAKSEFCDLAKSQRNVSAWNEHYHCLNIPARQAFAEAPKRVNRGPNSEFCELAKNQRNAPSWNEYYGCRR